MKIHMHLPRRLPAALGLSLAMLAAPAGAQDITGSNLTLSGSITQNGAGPNFFNGSYSSFNGGACLGNSCTAAESNGLGNPPLKLKWSVPAIIFEDTSSTGIADRDWRLGSNGSAVQEYFQIIDEGEDWTDDSEVTPFTIVGGAPENAFWLGNNGYIGLGTSLPQSNVHIVGSNKPALRIEQNTGSGYVYGEYSVRTETNGNFSIFDHSASNSPIVIEKGSENFAIAIVNDGVGIGTATPQAKLHVDLDSHDETYPYGLMIGDGIAVSDTPAAMAHIRSQSGNAQLRIEETQNSQAARALLNMVNYGRPDIIMANTATGAEWAFGAGTNFVLKTGAVGSADGDKTRHLRLYGATGNLEITGQIITGGTTCGGGCDAVFSDAEELMPQSAYAAAMWEQGFLPHVGPTAEGAPINMTEKLGGMLNALEHAHIYIDRQAAQIAALRAELDALKARLPARD